MDMLWLMIVVKIFVIVVVVVVVVVVSQIFMCKVSRLASRGGVLPAFLEAKGFGQAFEMPGICFPFEALVVDAEDPVQNTNLFGMVIGFSKARAFPQFECFT